MAAGDEKLLKPLREILKYATASADGPAGAPSWADSFRESFCLPFPGALPMTQTLREAAIEGDRAQLSYDVALNLAMEQKLVLLRAPDGTWAVDIMESVKGSGNGAYVTQMLDALSSMAGAEGAPFAAYESYDALRRLEQALEEYAEDHDGCLPPAEKWVDEIELYVLDRAAFRSPGAPDLAYGFAMNTEAGGRKVTGEDGIPEEGEGFLVLFEWPGGERNATATPEQLARAASFWPDVR